jgi:hypothetical protein
MHPANGIDLEFRGDRIIAILMRATFTAEHENGIARLQRDLGCSGLAEPGLAGRTAPRPGGPRQTASRHRDTVEERFHVERPVRGKPGRTRIVRVSQTSDRSALFLGLQHPHGDAERLAAILDDHGRRYRSEHPLAGSWGDEGCLIAGYGPTGIALVDELGFALDRGDLALWIVRASDTAFERSGLYLAVASQVAPNLAETILERDRQTLALQAAVDSTGMLARVQAAQGDGRYPRLGFLALHPGWRPDTVASDHPVWFRLDSLRPDVASGWYTVEDLDRWLEGHGLPQPKDTVRRTRQTR